MKLGLIGLPGAGKSTLFRALTQGSPAASHNVGGRFEVVSATVDVPDERLDALSRLFAPKKTTHVKVTYADVAGMAVGAGAKGGFGGAILNYLAGMEAFLHVVRAFESDLVPHPDGSVDPARDLAALDAELMLSDLSIVESRLGRLREGLGKGAFKGNKAVAEAELALFERFVETLLSEQPLRSLALTPEQEKELRGYGFLTLKPVLVLLNTNDDAPELTLDYPFPRSRVVSLRGKLEAELAELSGADLETFMEEYGVSELGLDRVIRQSYDLMGLQSFFTVGEDEVRAWTIRRGASALEAADTIHTDLARGFIRAEVIAHEELVELGGLSEARQVGRLRQEGKSYEVQDGEIVHIKFNI